MKTLRTYGWFLLLFVILTGGCTRLPVSERTPIKPKTLADLQGYLRSNKPDVDLFRLRGPFAVDMQKNRELRLSPTERINTDLYLSAPTEKGPLVILLHGYDSTKEAHEFQAQHLASWGVHTLTVQLPNKGQWTANGRTAARIVALIQRVPAVIDARIDPNRIILAGHSFGGTSAAVALAEGASAAGAILLDPAAIGKELPNFLRKINKPVMVLGADDEVSATRNRDYFYRYVRAGVAEVLIKDAAHEDGQYPSEFSLQNYGIDPSTTEESQIDFVSALTSAALSLSASGTFDYAWQSFDPVLQSGKFFNARRK